MCKLTIPGLPGLASQVHLCHGLHGHEPTCQIASAHVASHGILCMQHDPVMKFSIAIEQCRGNCQIHLENQAWRLEQAIPLLLRMQQTLVDRMHNSLHLTEPLSLHSIYHMVRRLRHRLDWPRFVFYHACQCNPRFCYHKHQLTVDVACTMLV